MKIVNEQLLEEFRQAGKCEWCGNRCRVREPHHIHARGMGGGNRLDVRINLVALGSTLAFQCTCHTDHHNGERPLREELLAVACAREKCLQRDAEKVLDFLALLTGKDNARERERKADRMELNNAQRLLVSVILKEYDREKDRLRMRPVPKRT